jgi:hypothetical protein
MVQIKEMTMPENCAKCPCLSVTFEGGVCGTPVGKGKRICQDSLYFPNFRPKWCPMSEVKDADG